MHTNNLDEKLVTPPTSPSTQILVNGNMPPATPLFETLPPSALELEEDSQKDESSLDADKVHVSEGDIVVSQDLEQTAEFFDPNNEKASIIREQVAMETLDELLDFIMEGGSVGIFDATNSTLERRSAIVNKIRRRAGPDLGVLFLESLCIDESLLEANMRLKLSGPDYKDQDPCAALEDFKKRVAMYQKVSLTLSTILFRTCCKSTVCSLRHPQTIY